MFRAMNIRQLARRALTSSPILLVAVLALGGSVAAAAAPNDIEGVWSFNGGAVAVQALSDGTFQGTVVTPTTFANCQHPAGQVMWTDMRPQTDGSFWGLHQWYHGPSCEQDPVLGRTAWRVLQHSSGVRTLKVCFNTPSSGTQPTIAADGKEATVTFGCTESAPLAPLPTVSGEAPSQGGGNSGTQGVMFSQTVVLPNAKACVSQTSLKIKLNDPKYDPLKEVVVKINGKKVADVKGVKRLKKGVTLKKLPSGTYKISVVATTVLNQHLSGSQTYRSCTKGSGKIKLHRVVKARHG
jgi:hypothetical protein